MRIELPQEYLLKQLDNTMWPVCIVKAPGSVPELEGYILIIPIEYVIIEKTNLILLHGNEWDKQKKEYRYMFEKEFKTPGHPSKRYRYTAKEVFRLYGKSLSETFDERLNRRIEMFTKGPGKLLKASYKYYISELKIKGINSGWFIAPDADQKWVYPFEYDPLTDKGKHNREASGFTVLEEYALPDIAVLQKKKNQISTLLHNLDYIQGLKIESSYNCAGANSIIDRNGKLIVASSLAQKLAFLAYNSIPKELRSKKVNRNTFEIQEGEEIRKNLIEIGTKMENICLEVIQKYQTDRIAVISAEIRELTGINIKVPTI